MRGFWKKRLPAVLLALAMTVGMVPAAMADETHHASTKWESDITHHWHPCTDAGCSEQMDKAEHVQPSGWTSNGASGHSKKCSVCGFILSTAEHDLPSTPTSQVPATCYEAGKKIYVCTAEGCGYRYEEPIPATNKHVAASSWSYNTSRHWHACTTSGCPQHLSEASHSYISGQYINDASYHWQECTVCGGISAKSAHTDSNGDGVCDTCKRSGMPVTNKITVTFQNGSSTYQTQTITKGTAPSNPGTPSKSASGMTYTFVGWSTQNPGSGAVYNGQSYKSSSQVASTALSANTTYYALYQVTSDSRTISYEVKAGDEVSFDRSDFQKAYEYEYSSGTIRYVTFETSDTLSTSRGTVYSDHGGSDETSFTKSNIDDYYFYYKDSDDGDYALNSLSFVAPDDADERTVELEFTAYYSSSRYVEGTVKIEITAGSSKKGDITYQVDPGDEVSFKRADFRDFFQEEYSDYDLNYVVFETSDTLSTSNGTVYYNYGGSSERSFTQSNLDDYRFYYYASDGDYDLNSLSFVVPKGSGDRTVKLSFTAYYNSSRYVDGTLIINIGKGGSQGDIHYQVDPGSEVSFKRTDFRDYFEKEYSNYDLSYVVFETSDTLSTSNGTIYYNYGKTSERSFTKSSLGDYRFYYYADNGDYDLNSLSFVAPKNADQRTVEISFTAYSSSSRYVKGTLTIQIGKGSTTSKADITYQADSREEVSFDRTDFNEYFHKEYDDYDVRYVTFEADSTLVSSNGILYSDYGGNDEKSFTKSNIDGYKFYYRDSDYGDYALNSLSFVASSNFNTAVTLKFRVWYSSSRYADGTLRIEPKSTATGTGDIRYYTTYNTNVQINPNDIARFLNEKYPSDTLQYVELGGAPKYGSLYYNYYGVSKYGTSKLQLTSSNYSSQKYYFSPSSTGQYALSELTYIPSGVNYCAAIPFTAYSSASRSVSGTILISVTFSTVSEVYGATSKGSTVTFPSTALYTAVSGATGMALDSIQLLELPASNVGTIYVGSGTSTKANTTTKYGYSSGTQKISQLRFVPASGYTGSVEIPYLAYGTNGNPIASGKFCLGVVSSVKQFKDMSSTTWCYKYVVELSDAKVIDGYEDGSFKPDNTVTYGAALKLIMLAAGYPVQQPTDSNPFSGYLARAKSDGLVSGNINLNQPITRLAVAQIAAKAMKLDTSNLSSVKPFTDTTDPYVQALNAAGIVEGYFSNGTSTYKPNNTLTRGQISAIVWRMERAN